MAIETIRNNLFKIVGQEQRVRETGTAAADDCDHSEDAVPELQPLDKEEQFLAQLQIKDLHPQADTPLFEAFPWLCCCLSLCPSDRTKRSKEKDKIKEEIEVINKRLNKCIKVVDAPNYTGTSFRREMFKKFGIPIQKKNGEF